MQQLSGQDASFLYMETPNAPMHIGGFSIYDPSTAPAPVTFKSILDTIGSRIHLARVFRQKLVRVPIDLDHPYWINDPDFDLEFHVRHIALPEAGRLATALHPGGSGSTPASSTSPARCGRCTSSRASTTSRALPKGSLRPPLEDPPRRDRRRLGMEMTTAIHDLQPEPARCRRRRSWRHRAGAGSRHLLLRADRQRRPPARALRPRDGSDDRRRSAGSSGGCDATSSPRRRRARRRRGSTASVTAHRVDGLRQVPARRRCGR